MTTTQLAAHEGFFRIKYCSEGGHHDWADTIKNTAEQFVIVSTCSKCGMQVKCYEER